MLDRLKELHEIQLEKTGDSRLETKIAQYEMGYRMQSSIPEVTAIDQEPDSTFNIHRLKFEEPGNYSILIEIDDHVVLASTFPISQVEES